MTTPRKRPRDPGNVVDVPRGPMSDEQLRALGFKVPAKKPKKSKNGSAKRGTR